MTRLAYSTGALLVGLGFGVVGCGAPKVDTSAAVKAMGWGKNVTISHGDGTFRFQSNGIPNHALQAEYVMPDDGTTCVPHPTTDCTHIEMVDKAIPGSTLDFTITTTPEKVDTVFKQPFGAMG